MSGKPVPWGIFLWYELKQDDSKREPKLSREWLLTPANVTTTFRDGSAYCRLCDSYFAGSPSEHVATHEPELDAFLARRRDGRVERARSAVKERQAQALHEQGATTTEIADRLGVSRKQVYRDLLEGR